jgi:hypothetical protein
VDVEESCLRGVIVTRPRDAAKKEIVMEKQKVEGGGTLSCPKCGVNPATVTTDGRVYACKQCRSNAISAGRRKARGQRSDDSGQQGHSRAETQGRREYHIDVSRLARAVELVNTVAVLCTDGKHSEAIARVYEELTAKA